MRAPGVQRRLGGEGHRVEFQVGDDPHRSGIHPASQPPQHPGYPTTTLSYPLPHHFHPFGMLTEAYFSIRRTIAETLPVASSFARLAMTRYPSWLTRMFSGRRGMLGTPGP